ncbi:RNA polymerase sigma factor (sigma-70 family) [Breznakia sp. PF5-3]|uniref:RNA polymerase sigma factor n=1 Tax=unclassified Breznakia TaxID=2623764 RepID=UPI0024052072|nr:MULTISPECIES: sigma-70 family RNA polymerase sigma factor [unclassified Breznakia]MDF9824874.1 RNA polymerase sigma factor (sigma-70 family) [Breznakia sp. PM6-1]MDF9835731.1 RNA polymerase sigma factor (sigma-70 family) [Breznakia sp. PF5-3]MDF9838920.1 RNA polymerase sigma factor (sigma-70 family) [Breznakia sp. PFB2-8]MDF9860946.1 RNA polymerase sigma factor (sigma-70 family) [Breznakia sp. PH5-24]
METKRISHEVIQAFKDGSEEAFAKIYDHYFNRVLFFAYNHLSDTDLAQDVVQNTFLSVYRGISKLQHLEAFHAWIMRIAYCECQNIYRKNKIKTVDLPEYMDIDALEDNKSDTIDEQMEDKVLQDIVSKEIKMMNNKIKDVAILKYLEGLSEKEISGILRIPKGTVKSRTYKAKVILQDSLKKNGITPGTYKTYGFSIPTIFVSACYYMQTQIPTVQPDYTTIVNTAKGIGGGIGLATGISAVNGSTAKIGGSMAKRLITGGVVATITISGGLLLNRAPTVAVGVNPVHLDKKAPAVAPEKCQIQDVIYSEEFTNQLVHVEVKVTNDNYDEILINGVQTQEIHENGDYVIQIMFEGNVVDERVISINNIDRTPTEYLGYSADGNVYTVYLNDTQSKINPAMIKYYKNGQLNTNFTFNQETQTIHFNYEDYTENIFEIHDNAGNVVDVTVVSKYLK